MVFAGHEWLGSLYQELHRELLMRDILQADETTAQVHREDARDANAKAYMWLWLTSR